MSSERGLFERIDRAGEEQGRTLRVDQEEMVNSVIEHLQKMLNVRQGGVAALPSYGLPDFNDLAFRFPDAIFELQRSIKRSIELYEPRLARVRIRHVPDDENPIDLRFEITAQLIAGEDKPSVWFETSLDTTGRVSIRG